MIPYSVSFISKQDSITTIVAPVGDLGINGALDMFEFKGLRN
jgi:hypothetical protein